MHNPTEQKVWIAFTHSEAKSVFAALEDGMALADQLGSALGISDVMDDDMRLLHMRMKWAHALLCPAAPSVEHVLGTMPSSVLERVSLNACQH